MQPAPDGLELPRPPGAIRRQLNAHPLIADTALAVIYLVPALARGIVDMIAAPNPFVALHLMLAAATGGAVFVRRQNPRALFALSSILLAVSVFGRDVDFVPTLIALYALAVYRSVRSAWIGFGITSAITCTTLALEAILVRTRIFTPLETDAVAAGFATLAFSVVAVLIGSNAGNRRRYLAALIDRARQLARERDQQAEIAAAAERSRIAREMHDIVSHSLTVMITLADGSARTAATSPERSAEAMRLVAETGRGALADMRRLLGVLRSDDAPEPTSSAREPQPGLSELGELVETFRAAGLPVRVTVSGAPPADVGQQLTVFRVVQEGLTNALRYASAATVVRTTIVFRPETVVITIDDDATVHDAAVHGSGRGLLGLRERVSLYGGTLEAGPRPGGGWRLRAAFAPVTAPSPAASPPAPAERLASTDTAPEAP